ncbi:MAG TPA: aminotransferase class V-fold PLP-dependent enzyme [Acidimicrobiia bacterium]|nr:aminotransferase class V-fold PLP-dependent enzyme [Acidimicrobiia bacterium]
MTHRVHLDFASTAPLRAYVREAMNLAINTSPFDPRRLYDDAMGTRYAIETSREHVANFFGCDPFEVIFTSSSTESLATFAFGVIPTHENRFVQASGSAQRFSVIGTPYDSEVIYETWLRENIDIQMLAGNSSATLEINNLSEMITDETLAITIPFAHPDTGTLQNIEEITAIVRNKNPHCIIHVDARTACGNAILNFAEMGIDAMTVDPVIFGGPSGVAALILSSQCHLSPLLVGATQERARRSGLENVIGIAGFGALCEHAEKTLDQEIKHNHEIKSAVCEALRAAKTQSLDSDPASQHTLSNMTSAYFPGVAASAVVAEFNRLGINIHAGSSCGSEEFEPSAQLAPVTGDDSISESVFRVSWGWSTTHEDIDQFVAALASLPFSQ